MTELARGLAAVRGEGLTLIALPAPVTTAAAIVASWPDAPVVAWSGDALTLVGVGVAHELRGHGAARWTEIVDGARSVVIAGAVIDGEQVPLDALGFARPRFAGGAAFAPGAADRAPWVGFGDAWFALPRWTYTSDGNSARLVLAVTVREAGDPRWAAELACFADRFVAAPQPPLVEMIAADPAVWRGQVEAITSAIAHGTCSKIVAARTCDVRLAAPVRAADLLAALDARHADCVRVLVRPPNAGTLVAATPERLVRRDGDTVSCDALAGTIAAAPPSGGAARSGKPDAIAPGSDNAATLLASIKDRNEHELVVRAIREALVAAGADVSAPDEPTVRVLRHVIHLHTPFHATLRAPRHVLELVARLHPTPAVGGTPTPVATDWITWREPEPRGWYSAPVGWFDLAGNGELAVAIRSGVLTGRHAQLWAGCGIVAGSDPDRELAETEIKFRAMLGALGVSELPPHVVVARPARIELR